MIRPEAVVVGSLKDEKLPLEKVAAGKTRLYNGASVHEVIVDKMYNCGFYKYLYDRRIDNSVCIGINPYGFDWHHLATNLTKFEL